MHQAVTSSVRFYGRGLAYVLLLQDPYPSGLFGDKNSTENDTEDSGADPESNGSLDGGEPHLDIESSGFPDLARETSPRDTETIELLDQDESEQLATFDIAPESLTLRLSRNAKIVVTAIIVVGCIATGLYGDFIAHGHIQRNLNTRISASFWSNQYRQDVVNYQKTISMDESAFNAQHPNWTVLLSDCRAIQDQYAIFDSVPYYPENGPDQYLISGLQAVYAAFNSCVTVVGPYRVTDAVPYLAEQFSKSSVDLKSFLGQIPYSESSSA